MLVLNLFASGLQSLQLDFVLLTRLVTRLFYGFGRFIEDFSSRTSRVVCSANFAHIFRIFDNMRPLLTLLLFSAGDLFRCSLFRVSDS